MTPNDRIARIRYALRHWEQESIADELLDQLEELRIEYRRNSGAIFPSDIAFLKDVSQSLDTIMPLANLKAPLDLIRRKVEHISRLSGVDAELATLATDPAFEPLKSRISALVKEFNDS